jgi:hypothetical protein
MSFTINYTGTIEYLGNDYAIELQLSEALALDNAIGDKVIKVLNLFTQRELKPLESVYEYLCFLEDKLEYIQTDSPRSLLGFRVRQILKPLFNEIEHQIKYKELLKKIDAVIDLQTKVVTELTSLDNSNSPTMSSKTYSNIFKGL